MEFQARDIERILKIEQYRYEYLFNKIGIRPKLEVEGRGKSHVWDFRNLLHFAFAHHGNNAGLSPKTTRQMLEIIDDIEFKGEGPKKYGLFDKDRETTLSINYLSVFGHRFFLTTGRAGDVSIMGNVFKEILNSANYGVTPKGKKITNPRSKGETKLLMDILSNPVKALVAAETRISINLGRIKAIVLQNI